MNWVNLLSRIAHGIRLAEKIPLGRRDLPNAVLMGRKDSFDNHPDNNRCEATTVCPMSEYSTTDSSNGGFQSTPRAPNSRKSIRGSDI
jgi:hypothetical protein